MDWTYFFYKLHFSFALFMTGVIWIVQIIHYPLFSSVGEKNFLDYHRLHIKLSSFVIGIPMIIESFSGLALLVMSPLHRNNVLFLFSYGLLVFIWLVTFFVSVPKHNIIACGFDEKAWSVLVSTNWFRTVGWSMRAGILFYLLS